MQISRRAPFGMMRHFPHHQLASLGSRAADLPPPKHQTIAAVYLIFGEGNAAYPFSKRCELRRIRIPKHCTGLPSAVEAQQFGR